MNFFARYKTIFLLLGLFLVSIILGFVIYTLFFKGMIENNPQTAQNNLASTSQTGFPDSGEGTKNLSDTEDTGDTVTNLPLSKASATANGGLTKVTELEQSQVLAPALSGNGKSLQYYNQDDGKFYRIDKNGEIELMSNQVFHSIETVTWANGQEKAILEYPDGANIVFDFSTDKQITLPAQWEEFDFSPDNDKLAWKSLPSDPENKWLGISNTDGSGIIPIEHLGNNEDTVYTDWSPSDQIVAMYTKGLDFNRQEVFFLGLNDENFKSTVIAGRGFDPKWSPEGSKLLYSVYSTDSDMKPELWIVSAQGDEIGSNRKNLKINTWASKCTYANNTDVYCAVPEELSEGAGIFPELAASTKDNLYKINTKTGVKKLVAVPDGTYNMADLIVDQNSNYLYFTDKTNRKLHQIKLK